MKKILICIISAVVVAGVTCAIVLPIVLRTPKWYSDARETFKNSSFAPEVQAILPGAVLDSAEASSEASTVSYRGVKNTHASAVAFMEESETISWSDMGYYSEYDEEGIAFDDLLEQVLKMRDNMQNLKSEVISELESKRLTEKEVWKGGLKYEENENGDMSFYRVRENNERGAKLSVYADGSTEAYRFGNNNDGIYSKEYSYFKEEDDKFIYLRVDPDINQSWYMSFYKEDNIKYGTVIYLFESDNEVGYTNIDFYGDDENVAVYTDFDNYQKISATHEKSQTVQGKFGQIKYQDDTFDLKAFKNIDEISFDETFSINAYPVTGIKLIDGSEISINEPDINYIRIDNVHGSDIYYSGLLCVNPNDGITFSEVIPSELSGLQLIDGYGDFYNKLRSESVAYLETIVYFKDFTVGYEPLADIVVNYENMSDFLETMLESIESHHVGF
ncbi:MAG: hypothetical protein FWG51_02310 [Firmicutes bacterium]|nr:hypothetical protein [Bacillota bacterium]